MARPACSIPPEAVLFRFDLQRQQVLLCELDDAGCARIEDGCGPGLKVDVRAVGKEVLARHPHDQLVLVVPADLGQQGTHEVCRMQRVSELVPGFRIGVCDASRGKGRDRPVFATTLLGELESAG